VNNARANAGLSATVLFAVQQKSTPSLRTICEGLFQVFKPLGRGELLIIKYCLVLPKRSPVSLKEGTFLRARHGFPLPCMKEEPAGLGGLDGSLVHLQFTPGEVSPALTRSRDVPPTTGVGVSGRANPSNSSQFTRNPPTPHKSNLHLGRGCV
jgi:hypothetical protein